MASIQIYELRPIGFELFQDSESFLSNLTDDEMSVKGGSWGCDLTKLLKEISLDFSELQKLKANNSQTIIGVQGNSINNNTYNAQSINATSYSNANTVVGY